MLKDGNMETQYCQKDGNLKIGVGDFLVDVELLNLLCDLMTGEH